MSGIHDLISSKSSDQTLVIHDITRLDSEKLLPNEVNAEQTLLPVYLVDIYKIKNQSRENSSSQIINTMFVYARKRF